MCTWGTVTRDQDTGPGQRILTNTCVVNTYLCTLAECALFGCLNSANICTGGGIVP